jgi:hypothetical protein
VVEPTVVAVAVVAVAAGAGDAGVDADAAGGPNRRVILWSRGVPPGGEILLIRKGSRLTGSGAQSRIGEWTLRRKEMTMKSVFTALVPALQIPWGWHWGDSNSGGTWSGYGGGHSGFGSGGDTWT